jgi:hypothetical protein
MNHTQTKLRVGEKYKTDIFADRAGHAIARTVNPQTEVEDEANARRLVACWNAFEGVLTEDVEAITGMDKFIVDFNATKAQRNELLEALKDLLFQVDDHSAKYGQSDIRRDQARAAIAKAEGAL